MHWQQTFVRMLQDTYVVQRTGPDDFEVHLGGTLCAHLHAPESVLSRYAEAHAEDGLLALGRVAEDASGMTAALGLLSVHVEETIATAIGLPLTLEVTRDGLSRRDTERTT